MPAFFLKEINLFRKIVNQFRGKFVWIVPCLIQSRLGKRQCFKVVLLRLVELRLAVIGIDFFRKLLTELLAEPFSLIPLPGAD